MFLQLVVLYLGILIPSTWSNTSSRELNIVLIDSISKNLFTHVTPSSENPSSLYFQQWRHQTHFGQKINYNYGLLADSSDWNDQYLSVESRAGQRQLDNTTPLKEHFGAIQFDHIQTFKLSEEFNPILLTKQMAKAYTKSVEAAISTYKIVKTNNQLRPQNALSWYLSPLNFDSIYKLNDLENSMAKSKYNSNITKKNKLTSQPKHLEIIKNSAKEISKLFKGHPWLFYSNISVEFENTQKHIVNSDLMQLATEYSVNSIQSLGSVQASLQTMTKDGMLLNHFYEISIGQLSSMHPDSIQGFLEKNVSHIIKELNDLRFAPIGEPYSGPVLLGPKAAAVFTHEVLGHRLEGHRIKESQDGQTFKNLIGQRILDSQFQVIDDPTLNILHNTPLNGHYLTDDQGIPARPTSLINNGIFEGFLESRSTSSAQVSSNGHGRSRLGVPTVSRMANTQFISKQAISTKELKLKFKQMLKKKKLKFGYYFSQLSGGFTSTSRDMPQSFKLTPLMAWKVYTDSDKEELVRGLDIVGTPLSSLSKIKRAGNDDEVFNGYCGAESGWIPVSSSAPSLLFEELEVEKQTITQHLPPEEFRISPTFSLEQHLQKKYPTLNLGSIQAIQNGNTILQIMQDEASYVQNNYKGDSVNLLSFHGELWNSKHQSLQYQFGKLFKSETIFDPQIDFNLIVGNKKLDQRFFQGNFLFESPLQKSMPGSLSPILFRKFFRQYINDQNIMALETYSQKSAWLEQHPQTIKQPSLISKDSNFQLSWKNCPPIDSNMWKKRLKKLSLGLSEDFLDESYLQFDFHDVRHFGIVDQSKSIQNLCEYTLIYSAVASDSTKTRYWDYHRWSSPNLNEFKLNDFLKKAQGVNKYLQNINSYMKETFYRGPVILKQQAAGYFFHQALIEPQVTLWNESSIKNPKPELIHLLHKKFLPTAFNIIDLPNLNKINQKSLYGNYQFDHFGEKAQDVQVIVDGKLNQLYTTYFTTPYNSTHNNGHYRYSSLWPGNLLINYNNGLSTQDFQNFAAQMVKQEGLTKLLVIEKFPDQDALDLLSKSTQMSLAINTSSDSHSFVLERPVKMYWLDPITGQTEYTTPMNIQALDFKSLRLIRSASSSKYLYQPFAAYSMYTPDILIELIDAR